MTSFIDDIVDKSVAQSLKKTSSDRDDQREETKLINMAVNGKINTNALGETPIKLSNMNSENSV